MPARLERSHFWQTARLLIACGLAEGGGFLAGMQETYWAIITAIVVTRPMQSDAKGLGRDQTLGSIIGGAIGLGVLALERWKWPLWLLLCAAFLPLAFLISVWPNLRLAAVTLVVVVLVPSSKDPFVRPFDRVIEILIGSIAGWGTSALLDSDRLRRRAPGLAPEEQ